MKIPIPSPAQLIGAVFFIGCLGLVFVLEKLFHLLHGPTYWIYHLLFGIGFSLGVYALWNRFWPSMLLTLLFSIGNEFWQDQAYRSHFYVDWDHFGADLLGLLIGWLVYRYWLRDLPNWPFRWTR